MEKKPEMTDGIVELRKADLRNFYSLMQLSLYEDQQDYVAPNGYSLAEAYCVQKEGRYVQPFGIFVKETPVGFAMIGHNSFEIEEDTPSAYRDSYCLWRFMIDRRYQKSGYGRRAVALLLDFIKSFPDGEADTCCVSYEAQNTVAKRLYMSFGFIPNGEWDDDEEIAVLRLR